MFAEFICLAEFMFLRFLKNINSALTLPQSFVQMFC